MKTLLVGTVEYRLMTVERDGQWVARAVRADSGDQFGLEYTASSVDDAVARLARWLEWQHEHAAALDALQGAERAYHRTIAGGAFASPTDGPAAGELQKESLDAVESARVRLDDVRARKPD